MSNSGVGLRGRNVCRWGSVLTLAVAAAGTTAVPGCGDDPGVPGGRRSDAANAPDATLAQVAGSTWDVNDISILFPLKNRFAPDSGKLPYLTEGFLSQAQFDAVLAVFRRDFKLDFRSGAQSSLMNSLDKWAVTAVRLDPCFKRKASDPCRAQVRLVAQAVVPNETTTTDFAMHLFYEPRASTVDLLREMVRLRETHAPADQRKATLGKPLGVHPILGRKGGMDGAFARALKDDFLRKHLNTGTLTEIAVAFIEPSRLQPWIFFRDDARNFDVAQQNSIFQFDPGSSENTCGVEKFRLICKRDIAGGRIVDSEQKTATNPGGGAPAGLTRDGKPYLDDFLTLAQKETDTRTYASIAKDLPYWEGVFNQIDNPRLTHPDDTNCSTCHRSTTDRVRFRGILRINVENGKNAFRPGGGTGCTPGVGVDQETRGMKTFNVRMFGYLHEQPIVARRVANETVAVCEELKRSLR